MNKVLALMISVVFLIFSSHASAERTGLISAKLLCGKKTNSSELTVGRYETLIDIIDLTGSVGITNITVNFPFPKYTSQGEEGEVRLAFQYNDGEIEPGGLEGTLNASITQISCEIVRQQMISLEPTCQDSSATGFSNCALNNRFFEATVIISSSLPFGQGIPITDDTPITVTGTYTVKQRNGNNADKKIYDSQTIDIVNYSWLYYDINSLQQ